MDSVALKEQAILPREQAVVTPPRDEWEQLAITLARSVHKRTGGAVRSLRVEVDRQSVRLFGRCGSFYCKQLAQQAVMSLTPDLLLTNHIDVAGRAPEEP